MLEYAEEVASEEKRQTAVFLWKIRGMGSGEGGGVGTGKGTGKSMRKLCRNYPLANYSLVSTVQKLDVLQKGGLFISCTQVGL